MTVDTEHLQKASEKYRQLFEVFCLHCLHTHLQCSHTTHAQTRKYENRRKILSFYFPRVGQHLS